MPTVSWPLVNHMSKAHGIADIDHSDWELRQKNSGQNVKKQAGKLETHRPTHPQQSSPYWRISRKEILEHQIPRRYNQSFGSKLCHSEELSWCCSLLGKQILPESAPTALTSHSHFLTFQRDATYIHATVVEDIYTILTLIFTEHNDNEDNDNKCNDKKQCQQKQWQRRQRQ